MRFLALGVSSKKTLFFTTCFSHWLKTQLEF